MRSLRHWTPRYGVDRVRDLLHARANPELPWLTPQANEILATMLRPTDRGLESGSGRSTIWLARHVEHLTSVEHDQMWHASVSSRLKQQSLDNVDYVFAPRDLPDEHGGESEYASVTRRFPPQTLDFALVDGIYRDHCAALALPRLRSGGLLILDNVNWFLPSTSRSPQSRRPDQGADGPVWTEVQHHTRQWRTIWTSSGVWDTAIFIKP